MRTVRMRTTGVIGMLTVAACAGRVAVEPPATSAPVRWRWDPASIGDRLDEGTRAALQRDVEARLTQRGWQLVGRDDSATVFVAATIEPQTYPLLTVRPRRAPVVLTGGEIGSMAWRSIGDGGGGCMAMFCSSVGGTTVLQLGQDAFVPVNPNNSPIRGPSVHDDPVGEAPSRSPRDTILGRFYQLEGRVAVGMRRRTDITFSRTIGRSRVRVATFRFWGETPTPRDSAWSRRWLALAVDEATRGLVPPTRVLYYHSIPGY